MGSFNLKDSIKKNEDAYKKNALRKSLLIAFIIVMFLVVIEVFRYTKGYPSMLFESFSLFAGYLIPPAVISLSIYLNNVMEFKAGVGVLVFKDYAKFIAFNDTSKTNGAEVYDTKELDEIHGKKYGQLSDKQKRAICQAVTFGWYEPERVFNRQAFVNIYESKHLNSFYNAMDNSRRPIRYVFKRDSVGKLNNGS